MSRDSDDFGEEGSRSLPSGAAQDGAASRARSDAPLFIALLVILAVAYAGYLGYRRFWPQPPAAPLDAPPPEQVAADAEEETTPRILRVTPEEYVERPIVVPGPGTFVLPVTIDEFIPPRPFQPSPPYIAAETCGECHAEHAKGCAETAHFLTLRLATPETVRGSFEPGRNVLKTREPRLRFEMTRDEQGMHQTAVLTEGEERYEWRQQIDLVSGSGKLGQTYLSWLEDQLFELPVSYFRESDQWVNSPGYMDGVADFARPALPRCLECHATYIQELPGAINRYEPKTLIAGVTCQRCHGPGRKHVTYHRAHPDETTPHEIVNPSQLPRERQLEVCEQCHSGKSTLRRAAFSYRPGELLENHLSISPEGREVRGDVHTANQSARIKLSRCFQESEQMTCLTCHDPHRLERGDTARFSAKCAACHKAGTCPQESQRPQDCISCHMPTGRETEAGIVQADGSTLMPTVRDHWIKVWQPQSK